MKAIMTSPSKIEHRKYASMCGEKKCEATSTHFILVVDVEGLPIDLFVPLCAEHANAYRALPSYEIEFTEEKR